MKTVIYKIKECEQCPYYSNEKYKCGYCSKYKRKLLSRDKGFPDFCEEEIIKK